MTIYLINNMKRQKIISKKLASELLIKAGYAPSWLKINFDQAIPVENGLSILFIRGEK